MDQFLSLLPRFWDGFLTTLLLLVVAGVLALVLGTVIAAMRLSPVVALRTIATVWTELARNTPLTLVFFFVSMVLPSMGVRIPFVPAAIVALAYYTSPFVAEALRSGVNGVPVGQAEAARSIGLGFSETLSLVVLPQAFRMTVPPMINVFIALTKNTSVAGGFFVLELFGVTRELANGNGNMVILILVTAAILYLIITVPLGQVALRLEQKLAVKR